MAKYADSLAGRSDRVGGGALSTWHDRTKTPSSDAVLAGTKPMRKRLQEARMTRTLLISLVALLCDEMRKAAAFAWRDPHIVALCEHDDLTQASARQPPVGVDHGRERLRMLTWDREKAMSQAAAKRVWTPGGRSASRAAPQAAQPETRSDRRASRSRSP